MTESSVTLRKVVSYQVQVKPRTPTLCTSTLFSSFLTSSAVYMIYYKKFWGTFTTTGTRLAIMRENKLFLFLSFVSSTILAKSSYTLFVMLVF